MTCVSEKLVCFFFSAGRVGEKPKQREQCGLTERTGRSERVSREGCFIKASGFCVKEAEDLRGLRGVGWPGHAGELFARS